MKIIAPTVLVALFATSQARFLDANTAAQPVTSTYPSTTFSNSLNCGQCIGGGYTYCINKAENTTTNSYVTGTNGQICYQGTNNANENSNQWSCSSAFADRVYSKYVCQYNTAACGTQQYFNLPAVNSTASFNITSLSTGQTCFYKVQAQCGAPAFKPTDISRVEVEYVEFRDAEVNLTETVRGHNTLASSDANKKASTPAVGMPRRDHVFAGLAGGNSIANANITTYNATTQGAIYGQSGRYDENASGRKVYGNPTQGDTQLGFKSSQAHADCTPRTLYLAVTATTDQASLRMDLSSVAFYVPPTVTTGASFLSMTIAAVFGLLSLAFF